MNVAVILAGGIGERFGAKCPKQFYEVMGKPILIYTIELFQNHSQIDAIEVVCHKEWQDALISMIKKYELTKVKWIADGGENFQKSVLNGICNLEHFLNAEDIVVVHFGVSPFVKDYIITDAIRVCKEKGNAISATDYYVLSGKKHSVGSVNDKDNYSDEYLDREMIACMNSPHAFKYGFIKNLYEEAIEKGVINEVEPHTTTLMYKMKKKIYFSKGSQTNIKITRKDDIELFEAYVMYKHRKNN